jgi:phosphomannomutase/phosphoglucomutase
LNAEIPDYVSTPTYQAHCDDRVKYKVVEDLVKNFKKEGYDVLTFEDPKLGGRVEFENGWGLVRASSNLPVLVLRFEATTKKGKDEIISLFKKKLQKYPKVSKKWETG